LLSDRIDTMFRINPGFSMNPDTQKSETRKEETGKRKQKRGKRKQKSGKRKQKRGKRKEERGIEIRKLEPATRKAGKPWPLTPACPVKFFEEDKRSLSCETCPFFV
jgi:hypothetical protein